MESEAVQRPVQYVGKARAKVAKVMRWRRASAAGRSKAATPRMTGPLRAYQKPPFSREPWGVPGRTTGVSIWRGRRGEMVHEWGESFRVYGPFETMLDDVTFSQYHLFRGEARILTGDESPPQ